MLSLYRTSFGNKKFHKSSGRQIPYEIVFLAPLFIQQDYCFLQAPCAGSGVHTKTPEESFPRVLGLHAPGCSRPEGNRELSPVSSMFSGNCRKKHGTICRKNFFQAACRLSLLSRLKVVTLQNRRPNAVDKGSFIADPGAAADEQRPVKTGTNQKNGGNTALQIVNDPTGPPSRWSCFVIALSASEQGRN